MADSTPPAAASPPRDNPPADPSTLVDPFAALKPSTPPPAPMTLLEPTPYIDPTPVTPLANSPALGHTHRHPSDLGLGLGLSTSDDQDGDGDGDSEDRTELQSIMLQFSDDGPKPTPEEVMSPRLEIASPVFGGPPAGSPFGGGVGVGGSGLSDVSAMLSSATISNNNLSGAHPHPPRKSSLEPLSSGQLHGLGLSQPLPPSSSVTTTPTMTATFSTPNYTDQAAATRTRELSSASDDVGPPVPPKDEEAAAAASSCSSASVSASTSTTQLPPPLSPAPSTSAMPTVPTHHRPPPPEADPEPALPFDFQRFLEQLRHRKADPIARYLKSFLSEFGKKQWMVHEQVKIISDFLTFIANKMAVCEVWRDVSDAEFDNAREGMEKLVMNRLYSQTFSPAIAPPPPKSGRGRRATGDRPAGPGRRGQHQEDVERDEILTQKINIYSWIKPEHLDIPVVEDSGKRFLKLAQDELLKIKTYRAPRDKIICVLNCCKVIFGLLKHSKSDSSADSFMPLLIYVVLQCNPEHLVSNVQYILRFRNQDKLSGEAGYYLSSLMGVIQFIENMDRTTLTITDEEFEKNVEQAVSAIAERHRLESPPLPPLPHGTGTASLSEKVAIAIAGSSAASHNHFAGESSAPTQQPMSDPTSPVSPLSLDQPAPLTTLFQTIQKPLTTIGRMFVDDPGSLLPPPPPPRTSTVNTLGSVSTAQLGDAAPLDTALAPSERSLSHGHGLSVEEAAARQASAETAEAQRLQRAQHSDVVDTLKSMFPDLERDLISDVVHQQQGRVGLAVDACLALSS